jgi:DMSO/TMAO reductase YedYZ molybdopterin-dependent catalytic subunit
MIDRRRFIAAGASGLLLGGCDRLNNSPGFRGVLRSAEKLTMASQRLISPRDALAHEYGEEDLPPIFRSNGTRMPGTPEYAEHAAEQFANWRLEVDGLVARPLSIPLRTLRTLPHRTQITRHDCVEGWSAIGKWSGVRFSDFLDRIGADKTARYVGFKCADDYYTSIDMPTALHPQTLLTFRFGDQILPPEYGFPMKLRMPTKLGFKNPKHIMALFVSNTDPGGYWEDQGYNWYSGS